MNACVTVLCLQVEELERQNSLLMHQAELSEAHRAKLAADMLQLEVRISQCTTQNEQLHEEASLLRQAVEVMFLPTSASQMLW